jgi:hypothetical protein
MGLAFGGMICEKSVTEEHENHLAPALLAFSEVR